MYIFSSEIFKSYTIRYISLEKEILPNLAESFKNFRCANSDVFDIGTPEAYDNESEIKDIKNMANILVTGGAGYLGSILVLNYKKT